MTYAEKLKHPKWQKKRLKILERDDWTCQKCDDDTSTLHVHHLEYTKNTDPWNYNDKTLITLCEYCHSLLIGISKEIDFKSIKVYKSVGWTDNYKIAFSLIDNNCSMEIFKGSEKIVGFNDLPYCDIKGIMKILRVANKITSNHA